MAAGNEEDVKMSDNIPTYLTPQLYADTVRERDAIRAVLAEVHRTFSTVTERMVEAWLGRKVTSDPDMDCDASTPDPLSAALARIARLEEALRPLQAIADAYDKNDLDGEARKFWGGRDQHAKHSDTRPLKFIELYTGRGGKPLLNLEHAFHARAILNEGKSNAKP